MTEMSSRRRKEAPGKLEALKIWGPILLVVLLGFLLAWASLEPPPPSTLVIAAGQPGGAYAATAERYKEELAKEGFEVEILHTAGSVENLRLLRQGKADLGLVQGGTASDEDRAELKSLASLFFEPVWVFHRADLEVERLADLQGRRIGIGAEGSGTRALALQLLAANGIHARTGAGTGAGVGDGTGDDTNDANEFVELSSSESAQALLDGRLDAAFFVTSPNARYLLDLARSENLELLSFRRHLAYRKEHRFLSRVVVGEGVLSLAENLPSEDVSLLAVAASLGARQDLHPDLIPLLLKVLGLVHGGDDIYAQSTQFPTYLYADLPLDPKARLHLIHGPPLLHRVLPYRWASEVDRLKILLLPLLTLLIPLFRVGPPLYRWRIRSRIYKWYEDLKLVDEVLKNEEATAEDLRAEIEEVERVQKEVLDIVVPLSYMDEFYRLRTHLELMRETLERRLAERS